MCVCAGRRLTSGIFLNSNYFWGHWFGSSFPLDWSARPAGQQAPGILLSVSPCWHPRCGCQLLQLFILCAGDWNLGLIACTASTFLAVPLAIGDIFLQWSDMPLITWLEPFHHPSPASVSPTHLAAKVVDREAHRNSEGWMIWICLRLIQQRREPPMATRRAPVSLPLWSKNFCRTA